ncbi:hypothetical protein H5410_062648 [Solanum commersonii]|uniref:Uncharacterized protein n=1 Tax=Solanum commersonii TaxID=4109 RepID=A0A9J5WBD5_SOLCO|nr:hypothetical protein H5410_062648 [Solanum commersonii]
MAKNEKEEEKCASICANFWGISLVKYLGRFHGFVFGIPIVGPTIPVEAFGDRSREKLLIAELEHAAIDFSCRLWFRDIEHV